MFMIRIKYQGGVGNNLIQQSAGLLLSQKYSLNLESNSSIFENFFKKKNF
jgi:hypothetical protein